jgi:hypothetical protein
MPLNNLEQPLLSLWVGLAVKMNLISFNPQDYAQLVRAV